MACLIAVLTSCSDFLKEVSQDEFEPKTVTAYQELLNGVGYGTTTTFDPITEVLTDDVEGCQGASYYYNETNLAHLAVYSWQPDMYQSLADHKMTKLLESYQTFYKRIMTCNLVIEGLDDAEGTEEEKRQTMGEALALRAHYFFYLVNMYAMPYNTPETTPDALPGVPLVKAAEIKDEGISRSSVAQVYAQICQDIEEACRLLDGNKALPVGVFRINYVAAHLLASRVYLYMENWDKVIEHVNLALAGAPALCDLNSYQLSNMDYPTQANNHFISKDFPEVIFINGGARANGIVTEGTLIRVSDDLLDLYDATNDWRRSMFFQANSYMYYKNWMAKYGRSEQEYVWRTAELYLNRAEAYAAKYAAGEAAYGQKAAEDLNALRQNRLKNFTPYTLTTAEDLMNFCHNERRLELCFEHHRWFDLRRYGMPSIRHAWIDNTGVRSIYTLQKKDPGYALPIPQSALDLNVSLVQNQLSPKRVAEIE
jgi:hypothetical protein